MTQVLSVPTEVALRVAIEEMDGPLLRGVTDCCTGPARAFARLFDIDPPGQVRYRTLAGARRLVRRHGGVQATLDHFAAAAGLIRCAPVPGVIVRVSGTESELSLGLCVTPDWFATKSDDGVAFTRTALDAWGLPWA